MEEYREDRLGLVLAYWALALALGRPLVSQTDFDYARGEGIYGSLLNHITSGRYAKRGGLYYMWLCLHLASVHGNVCQSACKLHVSEGFAWLPGLAASCNPGMLC